MLKRFILLFVVILGIGCLVAKAQGYWEHYNSNSGLFQNQLTGAVIEDEANIWLLSDFELSKFNSVAKQFGPVWNTNNSTLVSQNYKNLIRANNRIWFSHDNGLTAIDSGSFIHYSSSSGLLSNDIRDLTVDTSGNLWIASPQGVSHFNGNQFVHDTTVAAYHIAIDDSNRIFIVNRRFNIIFNNNGPYPTHQVYDGTNWSTPAVSGLGNFPVGILNVEFHTTSEGIFVSSKDYEAGMYRLSYPFHLDSVPFFYPKHQQTTSRPFKINDIHIADNGRRWITSNNDLVLFSTLDSILQPHFLNPKVEKYVNNLFEKEIITSKGQLTLFACNNGISIGYDIQQPSAVTKELNSNLIRTSVSSLGPLFHDLENNSPQFEFPKGNGTHGIYQAQIIHAHKRSTQNFYQTNLVNPFERTHNIGPISSKALVDREWVLRMTKSEIDQHLANVNNRGYSSPPNIKNWPTAGSSGLGVGLDLAPFVDVNSNGCYDPDNGDYPYIKGDEAIYWVNHIAPFEYHGMLYAYKDSTNTALQQTVFLDYTIINRDTSKYDSIRLGMYVDFDLGNAADDYLGADTSRNGFYVYNADTFDEGGNGYGSFPPALGVRFLSDDLDGFVSYANGTGYNGTPITSQDMYNYLQGKWKDGVQITANGNGRNSGGASTSIMYSGNPSVPSGWTEVGPPAQISGDRRGIASIPYFGLNLGEKKTISMAISFGTDSVTSSIGASVPALQSTWNIAKQQWDSSNTVVPSYVSQTCTLLTSTKISLLEENSNFIIYPNPSGGFVSIKANNALSSGKLRVFTSSGRLVVEKTIGNNSNITLNFQDLPQGMYFVQYGEESKKLILRKQ